MTDDEKDVIGKAISAATSIDPKLTAKGLTNDQFAMFLSQTKAQLDFVAEHIVPEPYQIQMMQATDRYIQDNLSIYNDQVKTIEQAIQDHNQDETGPSRRSRNTRPKLFKRSTKAPAPFKTNNISILRFTRN